MMGTFMETLRQIAHSMSRTYWGLSTTTTTAASRVFPSPPNGLLPGQGLAKEIREEEGKKKASFVRLPAWLPGPKESDKQTIRVFRACQRVTIMVGLVWLCAMPTGANG